MIKAQMTSSDPVRKENLFIVETSPQEIAKLFNK